MSARPGSLRRFVRHSLTFRVFAAVVLTAVAPQLIVFAWSQVERAVPGRMWTDARDAMDQAVVAVGERSDLPIEALATIAAAHKLRVRVFDEQGVVRTESDADDPTDVLHPVEAFFFGARSGPTLRELDEPLGPLPLRPEVAYARTHGDYVGCAREEVIVCRAVKETKDAEGRHWTVYVDKTSARAVQEVYFVRARLLRLALLTVPLGLVIGLYAARRVAAPIDELRRSALEKARMESPGADLPEHDDEVGELAGAVNALLAALERRRQSSENAVADLVHELKSPVAAVRAAAEALTTRAPDEERAQRMGRALELSSEKLDAVVTQFLDLARVEAGMGAEQREDIDIAGIVETLIAKMQADPRFSEVSFVTEATGGTSAVIHGVRGRLEAALGELAENAASFAGAGGTVTLSVKAERTRVRVSVADSGPGIAASDLPRVFDRFFTTRGARCGTGLGLALVRAVVEAHGGRVTVESPRGVGAIFAIELPRAGS